MLIVFYSPLVKNIAQTEGISQSELDSIQGTGSEGRVTKKDILAFVDAKKSGTVSPAPAVQKPSTSTTSSASSSPATSFSGDVEIVEMDRMRKLIADHMVMSKQTSPHVTSYVEADVTNLVMWRDKIKKSF